MPYSETAARREGATIRMPSKNMAQCMADTARKSRARMMRQNPLQKRYMDLVADIRCEADKRGNSVKVPSPPEYITKRLRLVDGFRIVDIGDGMVEITW